VYAIDLVCSLNLAVHSPLREHFCTVYRSRSGSQDSGAPKLVTRVSRPDVASEVAALK